MYLYFLLFTIILIAIITFAIEHAINKNRRRKLDPNYPAFIGATIVSMILVTMVYFASSASIMSDTEILNGKVMSKTTEKVSCRHSYDCNCRNVRRCSGSGKNRSCSTYRECDTCFEHSHDRDWDVQTTLGNYSISTIDRQGLKEPPRWTEVQINEPVAQEHTYTNYIKASPHSLFNNVANATTNFSLPPQPASVYDYWKTDRLILNGIPATQIDSNAWNVGLSKMMAEIGSKKQVNMNVVITNNPNSLYANALRDSWLGGKKNSVVLVIGAPHYPEIAWVNVFSWSSTDLFNVKLRDDVRELKVVDKDSILAVSYTNIDKYFQRKSMKEYKYLENELEPELSMIVLMFVLGIIPFGVYLFRHKFS